MVRTYNRLKTVQVNKEQLNAAAAHFIDLKKQNKPANASAVARMFGVRRTTLLMRLKRDSTTNAPYNTVSNSIDIVYMVSCL